MGKRLSKIVTKTGDDGSTGLGDGSRVDKDSLRIEVIGTIDELNSWIGYLASAVTQDDIKSALHEIQHALFDLGGELCIPGHQIITSTHVDVVDQQIAQHNGNLPALTEFILPGGGSAASICHLARSVCRRAERNLVSLAREEAINDEARIFLNRLSDLLFIMARIISSRDGVGEILWRRS